MVPAIDGCSSKSSPATPGQDAATEGGNPEAGTDAGSSADPLEGARESCTFQPGAMVADTIGAPNLGDAQKKIAHVIVVMKENRSFDEILGGLGQAGKSDVEVRPAGWSNPDPNGVAVPVFHSTTTCFDLDPEHQSHQMVADWDNGAMDGFVKNAVANSDDPSGQTGVPTDGHFVMAELEEADLPFYYFLAKTYALADHYHCSALAGTWANRLYTVAASSYGVKDTGVDFPDVALDGKLVFDALTGAGVTWGVYSDSPDPLEYVFIASPLPAANIHPTAQFFTDASAGTLPQVVFVEGDSTTDSGKVLTSNDEHPPADLQVGEAWSRTVYEAVVSSPLWYDAATGAGTALLWTYDENGSFADHVAPPAACKPADVSDADSIYFSHLGPRVPFVLVSPYARPGFVSHETHSHTSITRLIELVANVGALTARDANSDALLDMFDFASPALASPPAAPAAGTGGCVRDGGP
ncbi:MAG: phospholipase C [Polyangiaceae bacterium]